MMKNWLTNSKLAAILAIGLCSFTGFIMADDLPPYYGIVLAPAQPQPCTIEAVADFDALFSELGAQGPLDPASVRVAAPDGTVLPAKFEPDANAPARGTVRWRACAMTNAGTVEFRIYFSGTSKRKWEAFQPEKAGPENLLPNGGLEDADPAVSNRAACWNRGGERLLDPQIAHSGRCCLKLPPPEKPVHPVRWQTHAETAGQPGVVVEEGKNYSFRYWVRMEGIEGASEGNGSHIYWYKADKSYLKHEGLGGVRSAPRWMEVSGVRQAPPGARYAVMDIFFDGAKGQFYLDDLSINPVQRLRVTAPTTGRSVKDVSIKSEAGIKRFDFGLDTAVWPKFTAVTPNTSYSPQRGFGWAASGNLSAIARPLPDDLARDFILADNPAAFAVDLPDGSYIVWFLIGDNGLGGSIVPTHVNWSVKASGVELLSYRPDAKTFYEQVVFRNFNDWWEPSVDVYDRFIAPQYAEKQAAIGVKGGQARFEFSKAPLCAMIIYPAALQKELNGELTRLRTDRKQSVRIRKIETASQQPVEITAAEQKLGYAVFSRDWSEDKGAVYPESAPQESERITRVAGFASPGEQEPFTFCIYPLKDLGNVAVSVTDLKAPGNGRIPADQIEVAVVRYVEQCDNAGDYTYRVVPGPIQPRNPMPMPKGVTMRWWLSLRVPSDAKPGIYSGKVRIAPDKASRTELDYSVRVLPIKLGSPPIVAGMYWFDMTYWYIYWWQGDRFEDAEGWLRGETLRHAYDDMIEFKEFCMNSFAYCENRATLSVTAGGDVVFKPIEKNGFIQWMDLYTKAGLGPMPWYALADYTGINIANGVYGAKLEPLTPAWERAYRSIIIWAKQMERERGWPEVIMYPTDEASNEGATGAEQARRILQVTKLCKEQIPGGFRTVHSANGQFERILLPELDIFMPNHAYPITDETVAEIRKAGCDLWIYNIGTSRVTYGFYLWRMGAKGRFMYHHRWSITEPWNAFDGSNRCICDWVTPGKPLPTAIMWEMGEGIDDLRYLAALEKVMADARKSGKKAAVEAADAAQRSLDELRGLIPDNVKALIGFMDPREAGKPAAGLFADCRYLDRQRWKIADHILKIQEAMGQ